MKKTIYVLTFLCMLSSALALQAQIPTEINVTRGVESTITINLTNNEAVDIFNITFNAVESFTFPVIDKINANSTISSQIKVLTSRAFNEAKSTTIIFYYNNQIISQPTTSNIEVRQTFLNPTNISIRKTDTVKFINKENVPYTINKIDDSESLSLPANGEAQKTFIVEGIYNYYIKELGLVGSINIQSNVVNVPVHDPSKDTTKHFNIISTNPPTTLTAETLISSFTVEHNGHEQGALRLTSPSEVFDVFLTSTDFIQFQQNSFNFNRSKILAFDILPKINSVNQTNKTYDIAIRAKGSNTNEVNVTISIFIPFSPEIKERAANQSAVCISVVTEEQLEAFCRTFPDKCPKQTIIQEVITERNDSCTLAINELSTTLQRRANKENQRDDTLNQINTQFFGIGDRLASVENVGAGTQKAIEQQSRNKSILAFLTIGGIILAGGALASFIGYKYVWLRIKKKQALIR